MVSESERDQIWERLDQKWDLVVVGGGIVGAGIFREAARLGLHVLLVEQRDFAWGTSSRSSKFVHGGLRYLKDLNFHMARVSALGKHQLMRDAPGLVTPIEFLLTRHTGDHPGKFGYQLALMMYDLLAGQRIHRYHTIEQLRMLAPGLGEANLIDSFACTEALTDDARLTLRVLSEGIAADGNALNYVSAQSLVRAGDDVVGVKLCDALTKRTAQVQSRIVVNATGAWADHLRGQMVNSHMIRPQRGSHLVFPSWRLPVAQNVTINHPLDRRAISITPWHTATLVGSTDLDHDGSLDEEPRILPDEVTYLMAAVEYAFPALNLSLTDVMASYSGVRPIVSTGKAVPSKASRDQKIVYENGLLTVTGGKLTTYQYMAYAALQTIPPNRIPVPVRRDNSALEPIHIQVDLPEPTRTRLLSRYGNAAHQVIAIAKPGELELIPGTNALWVELRRAARCEAVMHLEDLMLRRVPLGILLPQGGRTIMPRIRAICQSELCWEDERWETEVKDYCAVWDRNYSLPDLELIPDWKDQVRKAILHSSAS